MFNNIKKAWRRVDRTLLPPKALYFCYFAAMVALMPFLALYYRAGWSVGRPYRAIAARLMITLVAARLGAGWRTAQRHRLFPDYRHRRGDDRQRVPCIAGDLGLLLVLVAAYAWFSASIARFVDNSVLAILASVKANMENSGCGRRGGVSAAIAGVMIDRYGLGAAPQASRVFLGIGLPDVSIDVRASLRLERP